MSLHFITFQMLPIITRTEKQTLPLVKETDYAGISKLISSM